MTEQRARSLYVFIDKSEKVYALIAVEERNVNKLASKAKARHFKKLRKREKKGSSKPSTADFKPYTT